MNLTIAKGQPDEKTYLVVGQVGPLDVTNEPDQVTQYWPATGIVLMRHDCLEWLNIKVGDALELDNHPWKVVDTILTEYNFDRSEWVIRGESLTWAQVYERYWQRGLILSTCINRKTQLFVLAEWI